jgi:hypothetical protein
LRRAPVIFEPSSANTILERLQMPKGFYISQRNVAQIRTV